MLGHSLMMDLDEADQVEVYGAARDVRIPRGIFSDDLLKRVTPDVDVLDMGSVRRLLASVQPDVVVNCVGVIKHDPRIHDVVNTISVNSLFPHLLAQECADRGTRLIHVSTDCVFSGESGDYVETDNPDPRDLYGRSKLLGEATGPPSLTLRTSIIGHELGSNRALVEWFLSQSRVVRGYTKAIYAGITTNEFAHLLISTILPRSDLVGLLHVASAPISKYDLLRTIARAYEWAGQIVPSDEITCDRSLSAGALFSMTGYRPPAWPEMIAEMRRSASSRRQRMLATTGEST
jgi:dTDP-4-dehydrorhamnose reductase